MNIYQCSGCNKQCRAYGEEPENNCLSPEKSFSKAKLKVRKIKASPTIANFSLDNIRDDKDRLMKCAKCNGVMDFSFFSMHKGRRLQVCRDCVKGVI